MKNQAILLILGLSSLIISQCSDNSLTGTDRDDRTSISLYFQKPVYVGNSVTTSVALVTASDMDSIRQSLIVTDTSVYGTIVNIPAGSDRKFEIFCYNTEMISTYYGSAYLDVQAGQIQNLNITLSSAGTVIISGGFEPQGFDDEKIVFQSMESSFYDICVTDPSGSSFKNLTSTPELSEQRPRFSPDRQIILYTCKIADINRPFIMNADGTNQTELNILPGENVTLHDWSPDGNKIVFTSNMNLYFYDISDDYVFTIAEDQMGYIDPRWSPTGDWIAFYSGE